MRISEFNSKIKYLFSFYTPHSAFRIPQLIKHLSFGQQRILFVLALLLLGILYFKFYHSSPPPSEKIAKETVVEVLGEVRKPGVYIFEHPPTLEEAIEKAGGLKEPASFDENSLSKPLKAGTLLTVQKESQQEIRIKIEIMEAHKLLVFNIPLDLNRVSVEDLSLIPGIGESLAKEIVMYRERRKGFRSVEELLKVKGFGDKKYQSLKNFFIVGN